MQGTHITFQLPEPFLKQIQDMHSEIILMRKELSELRAGEVNKVAYSTGEAAQLLGCSESYIRTLVHSNKLKAKQAEFGSKITIDKEALEAYQKNKGLNLVKKTA